ncbi:KIN17-like protein [Termitomyces sp. J132]|nr:KIN17-like protein [Termitomyces sp. J132]
MPRAEVGTPKYLANKMKSKGLQRLRWYCQVCEKQCRDENGFKCHMTSESHLRQMLVVGENAGRHISDFSMTFQSEFVSLLSRRRVLRFYTLFGSILELCLHISRFGTKRVQANRVYQEYISDKSHLHMNATRWVTLTEFVKHLGRSGIARVDETEKGWFIAWIDNSPKALAKQEASMKKDRATMSDEQRERLLIAEQIERAAAEVEASPETNDTATREEGLKREESTGKVVLSFSASKSATPVASSESNGSSLLSLKNPLKVAANPLKLNPLKKPNVFKTAVTSLSDTVTEKINDKKRLAPMSAAERLIIEDQGRKRRRMERETT